MINSVPPGDRAQGLQDLDLRRDPLHVERPFGVMWCVRPPAYTKRHSLYGELDIRSPWARGPAGSGRKANPPGKTADWDDPLPDKLRRRWEAWRSKLCELERLRIQRCLKPEGFGAVEKIELHHFSDASQKGYGQRSYVRLTNEKNQIHCALVMGKARVTPLKPVIIPRLELTAAVASVRVSQWLSKELDFRDAVHVFWTDSRVVLGYIGNEARRFHIFVANRVQEIHDHTQPSQWKPNLTQRTPPHVASPPVS